MDILSMTYTHHNAHGLREMNHGACYEILHSMMCGLLFIRTWKLESMMMISLMNGCAACLCCPCRSHLLSPLWAFGWKTCHHVSLPCMCIYWL